MDARFTKILCLSTNVRVIPCLMIIYPRIYCYKLIILYSVCNREMEGYSENTIWYIYMNAVFDMIKWNMNN